MARGHQRLSVQDVKGAWVIIPTPAKDNASDYRASDTVDLDETAKMINQLVSVGVDGILSLGTLGECATLVRKEKRDFIAAVSETVAGRIPFFAGTSTLNTRDTVEETRQALDLGADGTMLGPPMWCKTDVRTAVQFYQDVAEACPEAAICVYFNPEAFKFEFPAAFWEQVSEIPQIVCSKYIGLDCLKDDIRASKGRIRMLTTDNNYFTAARDLPEHVLGFWSSGAICGPALAIKLRDEVLRAQRTNDWSGAKQVADQIATARAPLIPAGGFAEFSKYNIGLEKGRMNAAGWIKAGPCRPPYYLVPAEYLRGAEESGRLWAKFASQHTHNKSTATS